MEKNSTTTRKCHDINDNVLHWKKGLTSVYKMSTIKCDSC